MTEKKVLEEIDLLKIRRIDSDFEKVIMGIELGKNHIDNLRKQVEKFRSERIEMYNLIKEKYGIDYDFTYNHETGEVINPSNK